MRMTRGVALSCLLATRIGTEAGARAVLSGPMSYGRDRRLLTPALGLPTRRTSAAQGISLSTITKRGQEPAQCEKLHALGPAGEGRELRARFKQQGFIRFPAIGVA
jgi:hypothetical protein